MDVCNASRRDVMEGGECRVENSFFFFFFSFSFFGGFFRFGEEERRRRGEERRGEEERRRGRGGCWEVGTVCLGVEYRKSFSEVGPICRIPGDRHVFSKQSKRVRGHPSLHIFRLNPPTPLQQLIRQSINIQNRHFNLRLLQ